MTRVWPRKSWPAWFVEVAEQNARDRTPRLYGYAYGEPVYDGVEWSRLLAGRTDTILRRGPALG